MESSIRKGIFIVIFMSLLTLYVSYFMLSEHEAEVLLITSTLAIMIITFYIKEIFSLAQNSEAVGSYYLIIDQEGGINFSSEHIIAADGYSKELSTGDNILNYMLKEEFNKIWLEESYGKGAICKVKTIGGTKDFILINAGDDNNQCKKFFLTEIERKSDHYINNDRMQHQKMLAIGQLASGISHDFNNILTAMRGYCDLILDKITIHSDFYDYASQLSNNITRASFLSKQLMGFAKKQDISYHNIDLYTVVLEISKLLARLIGEKITINISKLNESNIILGNENLIEQIIINLALNAKDAMKNGGSLNISVSKTYYDSDHNYFEKLHNPCQHDEIINGNYVLLKINDTGMGINPEIIDKIFDPFFTTKESNGIGVGLANVLGIVKQMNGHIFVESNTFGTGFYIMFNEVLISNEHKNNGLSHHEVDPMAKTILLVEDEEPVRVFSAHALRSKGYNVIEAENAEEALKIFAGTKKIDIIVSDVVMPGMNGNELVAKLLKRDNKLKVLLVSGYTEEEIFSKEIEGNSIKFLSKPFSLRQLIEAVNFKEEGEIAL